MIHETLIGFNITCKVAAGPGDGTSEEPYKLRIGGYDKRRVAFKGWVLVEKFVRRDRQLDGSFIVMQRDEVNISGRAFFSSSSDMNFQGSPISWRQLWKALIESESISPHVLRKS